jgi:hypothetical protein
MNPHRKYKNNGPDGFMLVLMMLSLCFIAFVAIVLNPIHKKNTEKLQKPKPIDRQTISTSNINGTVESIHPWGRTEIVPMKSIELEYFEYCDEWVMSGDLVQPIGRKDYFMPVLKGHLDLNVKEMTQTWIEYSDYETGSIEKPETYEDFRVAHILVQSGKVTNIKYKHYRLDSDKSWSIIAVWEAGFNEDIQEKNR